MSYQQIAECARHGQENPTRATNQLAKIGRIAEHALEHAGKDGVQIDLNGLAERMYAAVYPGGDAGDAPAVLPWNALNLEDRAVWRKAAAAALTWLSLAGALNVGAIEGATVRDGRFEAWPEPAEEKKPEPKTKQPADG